MALHDSDGWTLFDYDPHTQRSVWRRWNDADQCDEWEVSYPVDNILKANHEAAMDRMGSRMADWERVASVPLGWHFQHMADAVAQQDTKYMDKKLSEFSKFKTR